MKEYYITMFFVNKSKNKPNSQLVFVFTQFIIPHASMMPNCAPRSRKSSLSRTKWYKNHYMDLADGLLKIRELFENTGFLIERFSHIFMQDLLMKKVYVISTTIVDCLMKTHPNAVVADLFRRTHVNFYKFLAFNFPFLTTIINCLLSNSRKTALFCLSRTVIESGQTRVG